MALDGAFLSRIKNEIEQTALNAKVEKIYQPSKEEIVIGFRYKGGSSKLLLSANASMPRVHFTNFAPENPKSPPMFCMLLRKHLGNGRLVAVRQIGIDRILNLDFETVNELGDTVVITIICEIMGRHSNIIVVDANGKILDSVKRIDEEMSSVRQVLPGMTYALPPSNSEKLSLLNNSADEIISRITGSPRDIELSKLLAENLEGVSAILCREIAYFAGRGAELNRAQLNSDNISRLKFYITKVIDILKGTGGTPTTVYELNGKPRDFCFVEINQYGASMLTKQFESFSKLLDSFYSERDVIDRMRQRSNDMLKLLANTSDRISRKLTAQREELKQCAEREKLKICGDLITANLYALKKGDTNAVVQNYYEENMTEISIPLDIMLTPTQNAQKYYLEYRKADTAEKMLVNLISQGESELVYIDSVFDALTRVRLADELDEIRGELASQGYIRLNRQAKMKSKKLPYIKYISADGFVILSGRNNIQNDHLTLKDARNSDIWFHTQNIPGSHTVIITDGKAVPNSTLEQAAVIAAYNSKARTSAKVAVDYTQIKNIKKPNGAKPGMVIYSDFKTAIVTPDEQLVLSLLKNS